MHALEEKWYWIVNNNTKLQTIRSGVLYFIYIYIYIYIGFNIVWGEEEMKRFESQNLALGSWGVANWDCNHGTQRVAVWNCNCGTQRVAVWNCNRERDRVENF